MNRVAMGCGPKLTYRMALGRKCFDVLMHVCALSVGSHPCPVRSVLIVRHAETTLGVHGVFPLKNVFVNTPKTGL